MQREEGETTRNLNDIVHANPLTNSQPGQISNKSSVTSSRIILTKNHLLTCEKKRSLKIEKDIFKFYYKSHADLFFDFNSWLIKVCGKTVKNSKQICQSVKNV